MTDDRNGDSTGPSGDQTDSDPESGDDERFRRHWQAIRGASRPGSGRSSRLSRLRDADSGPRQWLRTGVVVLTLSLIGASVLFAVAGTWPLVVGVESGSMEPNIAAGDLVVLTAPDRFEPAAADTELGVVTHAAGWEREHRSFGSHGSVVVFRNPDARGSAIIHRVHLRVEEGDNWVRRANDSFLRREGCKAVQYCPAPHDGFITKGDANPRYDQASGLVPPVRGNWVSGVARYRIPLG